MDDIAHTASHMRKRDMTENDQSYQMKLSNMVEDEFYNERVDGNMRGSELHFKSTTRLEHGDDDVVNQAESGREINNKSRLNHIKNNKKAYQSVTLSQSPSQRHRPSNDNQSTTSISAESSRSYRSTTHQEIMSKYDINQIIKRKHEREDNEYKWVRTVGKVLLVVLLFPFSVVWLLGRWISRRRKEGKEEEGKEKVRGSIKKVDQRSRSNRETTSNKPRKRYSNQPTACSRCLDTCCTQCFCYYLCCECCQHSRCCQRCCTRCCRRLQKCAQCLCQNTLTQFFQNCFHRCFIRPCEKCCSWVCCVDRDRERVDTVDRLEGMNVRKRGEKQRERQREMSERGEW